MSSPLHVVVVNPYGYELFEPTARASQVYGGAEVQLYYLCTTLASRGVRVSMVTERPGTGPLREEVDGVAMRFVRPQPALGRVRRLLPVPSAPYLAAVMRSRPDVVVQRGGAVLTMDAAIASLLARVPFVFMVAHDWDCSRAHARGRQRLTGAAYLASLHRADLVIAQTADQAATLQRWHGIRAPVLRSGMPAAEPSARDADGPILWVGRCLPWKRPDAFLDLAATLPHRRFVMVCPAYRGEQDLAERVWARATILENVQFIPFVPFRETAELFAAARVAVNTSVAEGFPNTFLQATRVGTPVASLSVDADDIIRRKGIGVVGDDDIALLAGRIDELISDAERWRTTSEAARRDFAERHDLGTVTAELIQMLERAAAAGSARRRIRP